MQRRLAVPGAVAVSFACLVAARPAPAAVFAVATEAQLQAALSAAQTNGQDDTIQLAAGVYDTSDNGPGATFTYAVIAPAEPFALSLVGAGAASTFIDGNGLRQALSIIANGQVLVSDLTVRGGHIDDLVVAGLVMGGGAFVNTTSGDVVVEDCVFSGNFARADGFSLIGGALAAGAATGAVKLRFSSFDDNQAIQTGTGDLYGGAAASLQATLVSVEGCIFTDQTSQESGPGNLTGGALTALTPFGVVSPANVTATDVEFARILATEVDDGSILLGGVFAAPGENGVLIDGLAISGAEVTESGAGGVELGGLVGAFALDGDASLLHAVITDSRLNEGDEGSIFAGLLAVVATGAGHTATLEHALLADNAVSESAGGDLGPGGVAVAAETVHVSDVDARRQTLSETGTGQLVGGVLSNVFPGFPEPLVALFVDVAVVDSTVSEGDDGELSIAVIGARAEAVTGVRWTITGCSAAETGGGNVLGGLAGLVGGSLAALDAGRITGNTVSESGAGHLGGGALLAVANGVAGKALLRNTAIGNNAVAEHDDGDALGTVGALGGHLRVVYSSIWANTLTQSGAGVATGGGILMSIFGVPGSTLDVYNSVVWGNSAPSGADIYATNATVNLVHSDFAVFTDGGGNTVNPPINNLDVNPLFAGFASGDFHLTAASPVRDQGAAAVPDQPPADFDGEPRTQGPLPDMGADEFSTLPANQPPVNALPGAQETLPDTPLVLAAASGNGLSIFDPDVGASDLRVTLIANHGTLTLGNTAGLAFILGDGTADAAMSFTGSLAAINAALDGLVFTPAPGFVGLAGLEITTDDLGNTGSGGPLADTDALAIRVGNPTVDEIPTLGGWGLALLASGLAAAAAARLRRSRGQGKQDACREQEQGSRSQVNG